MPYYRNKDGSYTQVPKGPDSQYVEETTTRAKRSDVAAADVRTPAAVNSPLRAQSIAAYRAAGNVLTDPNRTVEDVQRAVAERVRQGREVRGASDYDLYREGLRRPTVAPPSYADTELQPNIATPEEVAAGTRAPAKPPEKPAWRQLVGTGADMLRNFPAFMRDAYEANDPGYFTEPVKRWMTQPGTVGGAIAEFDRNTPAPNLTQSLEKIGRDQAEYVTKPTLRRWGNAVDNYVNPSYDNLDMSGRGASAKASALGDQINSGLRNAPVGIGVDSTPMPRSNRLQTDGVRVLSERLENEPVTREQLTRGIYEVGRNSFTDDPNAPGARPYSGSGGTLNVISDEQFRNAGLRGRSSVTEADRARYAAQVAAAQEVNQRSALRTRQLAGASEGGDTLRQITKVQERADRAYQKAINRGLNSKAAARARDGILEQAGQLIDYDRNMVYRQGQNLDRELGYANLGLRRDQLAADQDYRQQDLLARQQALFADLSTKDQERLTESLERTALGEVDPESENPEVEAAAIYNRLAANVPANFGNLRTERERSEALDYAASATRFLDGINERNPYFKYSSISDLLAGADKALSGDPQRLNQEEATFWKSVFREGAWDGLLDYIQGAGVITLPGTDIKATTRRIRDYRNLNRQAQDRYFNPIR